VDLIEQLAPLLSNLRIEGFWMSAELEATVLDEVGETPESSM
jgi:predicted nucleic acid-binding protein